MKSKQRIALFTVLVILINLFSSTLVLADNLEETTDNTNTVEKVEDGNLKEEVTEEKELPKEEKTEKTEEQVEEVPEVLAVGDINTVEELIEAIKNAEDGEVIMLSESFAFGKVSLEIPSVNVILDCQNKVWSEGEITVNGSNLGSLTIKNIKFEASDKTAININATGKVILDNISIYNRNTGAGSGISLGSSSNLTIRNSTFKENIATATGYSGGAIYSTGFNGTFLVENSVFEGNETTMGGAVYGGEGGAIAFNRLGSSANVIIKDSYFKSNKAAEELGGKLADGGAIGIFNTVNGAKIELDGNTFEGNVAGDDGGAVFIQSNDVINEGIIFRNNTFYKNQALSKSATQMYSGGAIQLYGNGSPFQGRLSYVTFENNTFVENTAGAQAGAIAFTGYVTNAVGGNLKNNLFVGNIGDYEDTNNVGALDSGIVNDQEGNIGLDNGTVTKETVEMSFGKHGVLYSANGTSKEAGCSENRIKIPTLLIRPGGSAEGAGKADITDELDQRGFSRGESPYDAGSVEIANVKYIANGGEFRLGEMESYDGSIYYEQNEEGKVVEYYTAGNINGKTSVVDGLETLKATNGEKTFKGWNTKEDGTGDSYESGKELVYTNESIVLYAQWEEKAVEKEYGQLQIRVIDSNRKKVISGAKFTLKDNEGNILRDDLVSNAQGFIFVGELEVGEYILVQTASDETHDIFDEEQSIVINKDKVYNLTVLNKLKIVSRVLGVAVGETTSQEKDITVEVREIERSNAKATGKNAISITKFEGENVGDNSKNDLLDGATFMIINVETLEMYGPLETELGAVTQFYLPDGTYKISEKDAPEGYIKDEKSYTVTLNADSMYASLEFYNVKDEKVPDGYAHMTLLDAQTMKGIKDVELKVTNKAGDILATMTTDENGVATSSFLPNGQYKINFVDRSPLVYKDVVLNQDVYIQAPGANYAKTYLFKNEVNFILQKIDSENDKLKLAGATFTIYDSKGKVLTDNRVTAEETGESKPANLLPGNYYYEETVAPEGYEKIEGKIPFTIDEVTEDLIEVREIVENTKIVKKQTVIFEPNGGTFADGTTEAKQVTVNHGEKVKEEEISKTGSKFEGWFTDKELTKVYDFESPVTEDITLYAKWNINKYTVIFEPNGGTFADGTTEAKQVSVNHGEKVKEEEISKIGSKFEGWFTDKELTKAYDFESPVTEDKTLYAKWDVNKYTVIFEPNGGTFKDGTTEAKQVSVNHGEKVTSEEITKEKNGFGGWYTDEALTTAYDFENPVTEDMTLYAKWDLNKQTVIFEPNGGTFVDGTTEAKQVTVNHGEKVKEEEITKKDSK
ncbi:InlB B-repeat-containing protein, partial [Miniphocaeibacter massiliensis]|uniref:InlB B-repeat-containing protein n=1 Tax=Miniphocaeibacter massiliensis TaxID=2041841 RepID=UPI001A9380E3